MNGNYTYGAVITKHDDYTDIYFPDFDLTTCADGTSLSVITEEAQSALALTVSDMLDCGKALPEASESIASLSHNQLYLMVNIWLPYFKSTEKITYSKKTLTIPTWLDFLAREKNINFSGVLVNALKSELGIK